MTAQRVKHRVDKNNDFLNQKIGFFYLNLWNIKLG